MDSITLLENKVKSGIRRRLEFELEQGLSPGGLSSSQALTHLEFRLLYTLMIHRGQVLPTETIVEQVWGYTGQGDKELVRGLVRRLRTKVEPDPGKPRYILTVAGVGYSFNQQEE